VPTPAHPLPPPGLTFYYPGKRRNTVSSELVSPFITCQAPSHVATWVSVLLLVCCLKSVASLTSVMALWFTLEVFLILQLTPPGVPFFPTSGYFP